MTAARWAGAAARPPASPRRARRTDDPDLSPTAAPRATPLFVLVGAPPGVQHRVKDLGRLEAGDPAERVLELTGPDGGAHQVVDCPAFGHQCECQEYLRTKEDCAHIRALRAAGALAVPDRYGVTDPGLDLGRDDAPAGGGE